MTNIAESLRKDLTLLKEGVITEENRSYDIVDGSGTEYAVHFQDNEVFIEEDGIPIASYQIGGAGALNPHIKDSGKVLDALTAFAMGSKRY